MKHNEADRLENEGPQHAFDLDRERKWIKTMKFLLALFAIILIVALALSMTLNR